MDTGESDSDDDDTNAISYSTSLGDGAIKHINQINTGVSFKRKHA